MWQPRKGIDRFDLGVFRIRIAGKLSEDWSAYFGTQSVSVEVVEAGLCSTSLVTEPIDQAALVGMINHLNSLGLPVISVECLQTPVENEPSQDDS
jgi:hypothetical protein